MSSNIPKQNKLKNYDGDLTVITGVRLKHQTRGFVDSANGATDLNGQFDLLLQEITTEAVPLGILYKAEIQNRRMTNWTRLLIVPSSVLRAANAEFKVLAEARHSA